MAQVNPFLQSPFQTLINQQEEAKPLPGAEQVKEAVPLPDLTADPAPAQAGMPAPQPATSGTLAPPKELRDVFAITAAHFNVPENVLMALAQQESSYRADASNKDTGASGMMQYMDATAKSLGINASDPNEAVPAAAQQLRQRLDKGMSLEDAIKEHFAGPDRKKWGEKTAAYGKQVLAKAEAIGNELYGDAADAAPAAEATPAPASVGRGIESLPLTPQALAALKAQWNGATPDQRQQMASQQGYMGVVAREMNKTAKPQAPEFGGNSLFAPLNPTIQQKVQEANGTPALDEIDPKAEARARRLVRGGMRGDVASAIAADAARRGVLPGQEQSAGQNLTESTFDFDTQKKFNSDPVYSNPVMRAAVKGYEGYKQGVLGINQFAGELVGADVSGQKRLADASRGKVEAIGDPASYGQKMFEGAVSSIAQQLPALIGGTATGSEVVPLAAMFMQSFGQEYSDGRAKGQEQNQATARAALYGTFEVIGEKFGLGDKLKGLRGALHGADTKDVATSMAKALLKEIPGEELTTLGQFGTDKLGSGVGLNTEAGLADYLQQAADTAVQTIVQGGIMGGAATGVAHVHSKIDTPERQIARAIQQNADGIQFAQTAGQVALQQLDPNGGAAIDPRDTVRPPAPVAAPAAPAGPLTAAIESAAPPAFQADDNGFMGQILGDDGQVHTIDSRTGVTMTEPSAAPAGPLEAAIKDAAEQHAINPAPLPEVPQEAPQPPALDTLPLEDLRAQLKQVAAAVKANPEQRQELTKQRQAIEKEIGARAKQAKADSKPAEEPLKTGPFEDMAAANKMMLRYAEQTGQPHEVVGSEGKFEVKPIGEQGDGIHSAGAARGLDGHGRSGQSADAVGRADAAGSGEAGPGAGGSGRSGGSRPVAGKLPDAGADRVGADGAADAQPALTFKTSKGSTYTVNLDGTTTRDKAARAEHPGEQGVQQASKRTVYMTRDEMAKLAEIQAKGGARKGLVFHDGDKKVAIRYLDGKDAGKVEKRTVASFASEPSVGLYPVESWGDGYSVHFGNEITEINAQPALKGKRDAVSKAGKDGAHGSAGVPDAQPGAAVAAGKQGADVAVPAVDAKAAAPALTEPSPYHKVNPFHAYAFPDAARAEAFMEKKSVDREQFEAVQTGPVRWQVKPRAAQVQDSFAKEVTADVPESPQVPEEAQAARSAETAQQVDAIAAAGAETGADAAPAAPDVKAEQPQPAAVTSPAPTQKAKPAKTGGDRARERVQAENPFLAFVAEHGVHIDERSDTGGQGGRAGMVMVPGYGSIYRKAGARLDELAGLAHEAGFLTDQDMSNPADNGGTRKLAEMIQRAVHNKEVIGRAGENLLSSYTPAELRAREEAADAVAKAKESYAAKADTAAKKERDDKDVRARQAASADEFQLGQDAHDSLAGQKDIFGQDEGVRYSVSGDQTDTPAFKRWSGGAPLVRAKDSLGHLYLSGEPVVVEAFHGTTHNEITQFATTIADGAGKTTKAKTARLGAFFTDEHRTANTFAEYSNGNPVVYKTFVHFDKPLNLETVGTDEIMALEREFPGLVDQMHAINNNGVSSTEAERSIKREQSEKKEELQARDRPEAVRKARARQAELEAQGNTVEVSYWERSIGETHATLTYHPNEYAESVKSRDFFEALQTIASDPEARAKLEKLGYDGIIVRTEMDTPYFKDDAGWGHENRYTGRIHQFIAFHPEQVKSATGNSGAFDPASPDIRYSTASTLEDVRAAWDAAGIKNFMSERGGVIHLSQIVVPKEARGEGAGTKAMQQLVEYADRTGQRIVLTPSSDFGGSKGRLVEFYKRLGFVENKGRTKDFEVSESMYRDPAAARLSMADHPMAAESAREISPLVQSLADKGAIVLHADASTLPVKGKAPAGTQALTTADGTIHVVANALGDNARGIILHEAFHAGTKALIGSAAWDGLNTRLGALYRQGEKSSGAARAFWDAARARVETAKAKGAVSPGMEHEEFGAYAIEEYAKAPTTVRKWVDDLLGAVKAWALRRFGKQLGDVTPAQLSSLAKLALLDAQVARSADHQLAPAFSDSGEKTIEVDGQRRPIENSRGQLIAPDMHKQMAFWRWAKDTAVVDEQGRPQVVYKGMPHLDWRTDEPVNVIDSPNGPWAGFFTDDAAVASKFAQIMARSGTVVVPSYLRIVRPFIVDAAGRRAGEFQFDNLKPEQRNQAITEAIASGKYDGIIIRNTSDEGNVYVPLRPEQIKSATGNDGSFSGDTPDIRYSVAGAPQPRVLTPDEQGLLRRVQAGVQDGMNRVKQVQQRISEITGVKDLAGADYYGAETNRPGRIAARKEDGRDKLIEPMMRRLAKAGYTQEQLSELLHAQHAEERNEAVARINPEFPDGGSGMKTKEAEQIIARYQSEPALLALADEARQIARETLDMKRAYGLITDAQYDDLATAYDNYVPLKGDGEYGPKVKRAMGHGEREEHVVENIARDFEQAIVVGEKNLARQSLLQMVLQYPDDGLWTARVPPKGRYVAGTVFEISPVGTRNVEASFTSQSQVAAWLEGKGAAAAGYEVNTSGGERVTEFTKPLQDNEVMVYVKGSPVRVQVQDEVLARQLRPLHTEMMNTVLGFMQKHNRYLSTIYTGYNPAFILKNATRDAITGSINMTGNHGAATAAKAWAKYPAAWATMLKWAMTKEIPAGAMGDHLREYRAQGGKIGASYMSDLEEQGKSLQRMFDDAKGVSGYAADGRIGKAAWIASRKAIGGMAHAVEVLNQAFENSLRLALFATLREQGAKPGQAAQAAKTVTVNFDRKGTATPYLGAFYLFINPAIQGTANVTSTLARGEHKGQAWALAGMMAAAGFAAAIHGMDDDKDRWLGEKWDTRTKNLRIRVGSHTINVPMSQEYAPFYAVGVAMGEVRRGQSSLRAAANVLSSFLDSYYPMQGAIQPGSDNYGMDLLMAHVPTVGKMAAQIAANRNSFGNKVVPETDNTKNRPDNLKMYRGTKNSAYDASAQGIAAAGQALGADKYGNDLSKVSPETLKLIWSTYTGGLGKFVADSAGLGAMLAQGPGQIEVGDWPVAKDFVKADKMLPLRTRYFDLSKEAQDAIDQFAQAKKMHDAAEMKAIATNPEKGPVLGLAKMVTAVNKIEAVYSDMAVNINADKTLGPADKRARLKDLEDKQEVIYRKAIAAFKK